MNAGMTGSVQEADDVCALPLVRRLAATLDLDPRRWREGDPLPRGWHLAFFSVDTPHSQVRADGLAGLGVALPDLGLPRIVFGGRTIRFHDDIPIGVRLRRTSTLVSVMPKEGRSGKLAVARIEHRIFVEGRADPSITEAHSYVMRAAATSSTASPSTATAAAPRPAATHRRVVVPDEILLFRVSAVMFNPHRIHYDHPYTIREEAYPALVVNGSVTSLLLLEHFRAQSGIVPDFIDLRNVGLAYCGQPLALNAEPGTPRWKVWADSAAGVAVEGEMGLERA